jgi:hypothetical protein
MPFLIHKIATFGFKRSFHKHGMSTSEVKEFEWDDHYDFPRDLVGYGENSFNPQWPNGAKIAVSFVINYEEAGYTSCQSFSSDISPGRRELCTQW